MTISVENLTQKDYELLSFINKFDSVSKSKIGEHFKNKIDSIDYRLSELSAIDYNGFRPIANSNYIAKEYDEITDPNTHITSQISKDSFHVTDLGKKVLQDYNLKLKLDKRNFWLKSIFVPIIVASVTTILIDVLKWLLPLILR